MGQSLGLIIAPGEAGQQTEIDQHPPSLQRVSACFGDHSHPLDIGPHEVERTRLVAVWHQPLMRPELQVLVVQAGGDALALPAGPPRNHRSGRPLRCLAGQASLTHPRVPGKQNNAADPSRSLRDQLIENGKLGMPTDQHARFGTRHDDTVTPARISAN